MHTYVHTHGNKNRTKNETLANHKWDVHLRAHAS